MTPIMRNSLFYRLVKLSKVKNDVVNFFVKNKDGKYLIPDGGIKGAGGGYKKRWLILNQISTLQVFPKCKSYMKSREKTFIVKFKKFLVCRF